MSEGTCDLCDQRGEVFKTLVYGIETYVCEECEDKSHREMMSFLGIKQQNNEETT